MSGRVITLFPKRAFDYTFMTAGTTQVVTIHRALRIPPFYYYWLGVRVHNKDIVSGTMAVELYQTLPSSQDPQEFTVGYAPPTYTPAMAVNVSTTGTAPFLATPVTSTNLGPYMRVVLRITAPSTGRLYAELSAVLHVRAP